MCSQAKSVLVSAVVLLSLAPLPSEEAPEKLFGLEQQQQLQQLQQLQQPLVDDGGVQFRQNGATAGQNGDSAPAQYEFAYDVKVPEEGNDYGHAERRNGDTTEGMYRVLLPDGRVQVVTYSVIGNSGFVATVSYQ